jgi:hypothetical protein
MKYCCYRSIPATKRAHARAQCAANARAAWIQTVAVVALLVLLSGCATGQPEVNVRRFDFQHDTFAFPNELAWEYQYNAQGKWTTHARETRPDYSNHCFVMARSARQFFIGARFDPNRPPAEERICRQLIRCVVSVNPRHHLPEAKKIIIPGYADLRSFSQAREKELKAECGGAWQSYFQRGHWRSVFSFSRANQQRMAQQLLRRLKTDGAPVLHLVRFPELTINHAVVFFDAKETEKEIQFLVYDPNLPAEPRVITYQRANKTFVLPANDYFPGGRVDVYEVYHRWDY